MPNVHTSDSTLWANLTVKLVVMRKQRMVLFSAVLACLVLLARASTAAQSGPHPSIAVSSQTEEFPVATGPTGQWNPAVDGNLIVWSDEGQAIYGYDIATQSRSLLVTAATGRYIETLALQGQTLVWTEREPEYPRRTYVLAMDLTTGTPVLIANTGGTVGSVDVWGDVIIWVNQSPAWNWSIESYDLGSGAARTIKSSPGFYGCPGPGAVSIAGDLIVYTGNDGGIYVIDIQTGQERSIVSPWYCANQGIMHYNGPADIAGTIVVWLDGRVCPGEQGPNIYGYDLATSTEFPIARSAVGGPRVSDTLVVWPDGRYTQTIYGYDLIDRTEYLMSSLDGYFHSGRLLAVSGDVAAWTDLRNENWDIYGARLIRESTYSIRGTILDTGGAPVAGATVSDGQGHTATSGSDGAYLLAGLGANTYTITPSKGGYVFSPTSRTVTVPPDATGQDFTARRLPADSVQSTISVQPSSAPADGTRPITITVQLRSANGQPAWGKTVRLLSSRGVADVITQPAITDSQGVARGAVRSNSMGTATISAFVFDDGITLANTATVVFEAYAPPSGDFLFQLNQTTDTAIHSLYLIADDTGAAAADGDYFYGAVGSDTVQLGADIAFGMMDIVGGIQDWTRIQRGWDVALPGWKDLDGPFWPGILDPAQEFKNASHLFRTDIWYWARHGTKDDLLKELAYTGVRFFGASLKEELPGALEPWVAEGAVREMFANADGMTTLAYPYVRDTAQELMTLLDLRRDNLIANLPAVTLADQRAYADDLIGRKDALRAQGLQLNDERVTLANLRGARERDPGLLLAVGNFLGRFFAKAAATAVFDGPGTIVVGGGMAAFDAYMDGHQLSESLQMHQLALDTVLGAPAALEQTYTNAFSGLDRIARGLPADRATGKITGVHHYTQGTDWVAFWQETASWSDIYLVNTGKSETTYRVLVSYVADTSRFGVPWATMHLVEEGWITLGPSEGDTVRVFYKRANGTRGFSPRSETCIPLSGCAGASIMNVEVLGTNDAGTYYVTSDNSTIWQPSHVSLAGVSVAGLADDLPIIDPPLTGYVLSAPWTQQHEVQLWINNPFTSTVPVTITQVLPVGTILLDAGGALQVGNVLTWTTTVEASALKAVTCTFSFPAAPGTPNTLSPATLSLISPLDGQPLTDESNAVDFQAIWPVTIDRATPGYVLPGAGSDAVITVTNWLTDANVTGNLAISVTDSLSTTVHTESRSFNVPARAAGAITFALPASLAPGDYQITGAVTTAGASATVFSDLLQIGLPGPWLNYRSLPAGPVHANDVITYTLRFTNTIGVPLTSAVITASLPTSATLIAESVTGGGLIETGQIRWSLGTISLNQGIEWRFAVRVNSDAVLARGESGRLLSEARLTATEIAPTWGPLAWNLVQSWPLSLYLPLVFKQ